MADERQRPGQQDDGLGSPEAVARERRRRRRLREAIYDLDFSVRKTRRYHEKLARFYGIWRDWVKIVTIVTGSGLFFLLMADAHKTAEALAGFVAVWAALDYLIAPDKKAEQHHDLCSAFIDLAAKIQTMERTEEAYQQLHASRLELEKTEPPCKRLVDLQARNEECRAQDYPPEDIVPLSRAQRTFGYFVTFGLPRLENWKAARQRQVRAEQEQRAA